jgi:hypothetical protein
LYKIADDFERQLLANALQNMNRKGMFCAMLAIAGVVYFFGEMLISRKSVPTRVKYETDAASSNAVTSTTAKVGYEPYFAPQNRPHATPVSFTNRTAGR